ncbi:hypothetical protein DLAC_11217 [Tieghemostelium lacteum]|uniref:Uncharacterized protein n=1 Tax=Tieghemostelium lacteum TaxID=361077 RepID=A0A151Z3H4_TIELA|nr:hypothetical protein DLAC_11217 [Tieghemostelium lacteum]|eukprot:KYQ88501.1 hypothetical protein DLAC_11217 [Tieghemostelium lacteum]
MENQENDDSLLNFDEMSRDGLVELIQEIRGEYYMLEDKFESLGSEYKGKIKEIEFNRKLLTEREDLLLQLQWDPNQDASYLYQMGARDEKHAQELKMKALMDQMRIMEKGVYERDEKIKQLEKVVEKFTLAQIDQGMTPNSVQIPSYSTIPPNNQARGFQYDIQNHKNPSGFKSLSEYPLKSNLNSSSNQVENSVHVVTHQSSPVNRTPSFWQSPTGYINSWFSKKEEEEESEENQSEKENQNQIAKELGVSDNKTVIIPLDVQRPISTN